MPLPDATPSSPLSVLSEQQFLLDGTPVRVGGAAAAAQSPTSPMAQKRNLSQTTPPPQAATTPEKDGSSTSETRDRQSFAKSLSPSVMRKVGGTERQTRSTRSASRAAPQQPSPTPDITMAEDDEDEPPSPTVAAGRKRKASVSRASVSGSAKKIVLAKKPRNGATATAAARWSVPAIYASAKSPLAKVDLRALLLHPKAWASLRPDQQEKLRAGFGLKPGEDMSALANDDSFRYDCARYTEAIENEQFSNEWLTEAWTAHERRKRGEFDEFLRGKLERDWGAVVPPTKRELQLKGELAEGRSSSASAQGEARNPDDEVDLIPPPKQSSRQKASLVDRGVGVQDDIAAMGPPKRAARQKASGDNGSIDLETTEDERSREPSGTHASTVGKTEFTELRLGLRPQEEKDTDQEMTDAGGGKGQVATAAAAAVLKVGAKSDAYC